MSEKLKPLPKNQELFSTPPKPVIIDGFTLVSIKKVLQIRREIENVENPAKELARLVRELRGTTEPEVSPVDTAELISPLQQPEPEVKKPSLEEIDYEYADDFLKKLALSINDFIVFPLADVFNNFLFLSSPLGDVIDTYKPVFYNRVISPLKKKIIDAFSKLARKK